LADPNILSQKPPSQGGPDQLRSYALLKSRCANHAMADPFYGECGRQRSFGDIVNLI
jgi:hypothetical protein